MIGRFLSANVLGVEGLGHRQGPVVVVLVVKGVLERVRLTSLDVATGVGPGSEFLVIATTEEQRLSLETFALA